MRDSQSAGEDVHRRALVLFSVTVDAHYASGSTGSMDFQVFRCDNSH
jgi:hypothetical protein